MVTSCAIVFFIFQLPALIKAPLPQRYVQGYEGLQTPKPPTVQRTLETGEVNDTGAFQADPILKHDEKIPSLAAATTPLPPFLHPLLRNKRETNGISSPSVPLPPYIHPILRCKRGTDDEDCPAVFIPSRTSQPGASATQTEEEHDEEECYYHKLRKTSHETEERPAVSQVKECEGELRRMRRYGDGDALLTLDFAMKLMPMRGREATTDWYGQRGMPWHVTHVTTFKNEEYYQHNLVHILQQKDRQDSATVTAIIRHSFEQLINRGIKRVFLRSDQAGAYKSSSTLISVRSIAKEVGMNVVGWFFSEAQAGKGPCDRSAATTKMIVRNWCDAGGRVISPLEFFEALKESKIYDGRSYYLVTVEGSKSFTKPVITKSSIAELSKYNAISYEKNNLRVWRFWNIGRGKEISYNKMVPNDARLAVTYSAGALSDENFWMKMGSPQHIEQLGKTVEEEGQCEKKEKKCTKPKPESKLFRCPIETCSKEFLTLKHLDIHMTVGKHLEHLEKMNVLDYALHQFGVKLETDTPPRMCPIIDETIDSIIKNNENGRSQLMGWALPKRRKSNRFPPHVKAFLKKLYDIGEDTGAKTDAHEAARLMRIETNKKDGTMYFKPEHLLNYRQIAGVYAGFKTTKLDRRDKILKENDPDPDEVNDLLFDPEGDPELEFKTEPLFDEADLMRTAIRNKHTDFFDGEVDHDQELKERGIKPKHSFRGFLGGAKK